MLFLTSKPLDQCPSMAFQIFNQIFKIMRSKLITDYIINRCANPNSDIYVETNSKDGDFCPFDQASAHDLFYKDEETGHRTDILSKALIEKVQSASSAMLNHPILSQLPETPPVPEETQSELGVKSRYISSLAEQSRYLQMLSDIIKDDNTLAPEPTAPEPTAPEPTAPEPSAPDLSVK